MTLLTARDLTSRGYNVRSVSAEQAIRRAPFMANPADDAEYAKIIRSLVALAHHRGVTFEAAAAHVFAHIQLAIDHERHVLDVVNELLIDGYLDDDYFVLDDEGLDDPDVPRGDP